MCGVTFLMCVHVPSARQPEHPVQPHEPVATAIRRGPRCPHCHVLSPDGAPGSTASCSTSSAGRLHGPLARAKCANSSLLQHSARTRPGARQSTGDATAGLHATANAAGMLTQQQMSHVCLNRFRLVCVASSMLQ